MSGLYVEQDVILRAKRGGPHVYDLYARHIPAPFRHGGNMRRTDLQDALDRFLSHSYVTGMQTTLRLPDDLYREAKAAAAREGISLTQLLIEAIAMRLGRRTSTEPWKIPTSSVHRGLSEADTMAFVEAAMRQMEQEDDAALLRAVKGGQ